MAADEEPDRALMWQKARKIKIDDDNDNADDDDEADDADDEDSDLAEIGKRIVSIYN